MGETFKGKWEKRWHPLQEGWVVYAGHRNARPWTVSKNHVKPSLKTSYDPECYLCPGNKRIHGSQNPNYSDVYIFDNDHPVVGVQAPEIGPEDQPNGNGLYVRQSAFGKARVVCYDPNHNLTLAEIGLRGVQNLLFALQAEMTSLAQTKGIKHVLFFENKGEIVGVSNPHPHGQIYATDFINNAVATSLKAAEAHRLKTGRNLYADLLENERLERTRIIAENEFAIAFVPFFAQYAYEVMIFPKQQHGTIISLSEKEIKGLSLVFLEVIRKFDALFDMSFPYVMSFHQAPFPVAEYPEHHFYILFQPPLRQPDLKKFLAGPESGAATFMADTIPEEKAQELIKLKIKID